MSVRFKLSTKAYEGMNVLQEYVDASSLPRELMELVKMRASQMNGCSFCLDMHSKDALALGIATEKLFALDAWQEAPFYDERERAALEWAEALTQLAPHRVPDEVYESVRRHFTEQELGDLTIAIVTINGWNRLAISTRMQAGRYRSTLGQKAEAATG
jgi:AhpD family alkylhydroperoxidase